MHMNDCATRAAVYPVGTRALVGVLVASPLTSTVQARSCGFKSTYLYQHATLPATQAVSSPAAGVSARLMDYVTVSAAWQTEADALGGPLAPGRYGIVLMDDRSDDKPLKARG